METSQSFSAKLEPLRHMLKFQPFLGGDGPLFADYIVFGALQWARIASPRPPACRRRRRHDWFERCSTFTTGLGRSRDSGRETTARGRIIAAPLVLRGIGG